MNYARAITRKADNIFFPPPSDNNAEILFEKVNTA